MISGITRNPTEVSSFDVVLTVFTMSVWARRLTRYCFINGQGMKEISQALKRKLKTATEGEGDKSQHKGMHESDIGLTHIKKCVWKR